MHYSDQHAITSRLLEVTEHLSTGCDPDFDASQEELEREFAELRLHFGNYE